MRVHNLNNLNLKVTFYCFDYGPFLHTAKKNMDMTKNFTTLISIQWKLF